MSAPKLPPLSPPSIPASQQTTGKSGGPDIFFILMMTLCVFIFLQTFNKKEPPAPPIMEETQETVTDVALPTAEEALTQLPEELALVAGQEQTPRFVTLGSLDPESPWRMLVTLSNQGAAVTRVELNEKAYNDTHDKTGYLGQIIVDEALAAAELEQKLPGLGVQVVGAGTPAAKAGLTPGDRIVSAQLVGNTPVAVDSFDALRTFLLGRRPGESIVLSVLPHEAIQKLESVTPETLAGLTAEAKTATLTAAPMPLIRPEGLIVNYSDYENLRGLSGSDARVDLKGDLLAGWEDETRKKNGDPASFLMTLASYDDAEKLPWATFSATSKRGDDAVPSAAISRELAGTDLRTGLWEYLETESSQERAVFRKILPQRKLEVRKIWTLEPGSAAARNGRKDLAAPDYHFNLTVELRNLDAEKGHKLSWLLDGPTGLPIEGAWYSTARKTGPGWGMYGLRDLVLRMNEKSLHVLKCSEIAKEQQGLSEQANLDFIGVDTQYFQCTLLPEMTEESGSALESYVPIRVGARRRANLSATNVSFRLKSTEVELAKAGEAGDSVSQEFRIFAGPKQPQLLAEYGLGDTLVYGWFWFVAKPLLAILHFFRNYMVFNYGLAIVLLTILVRLLLFPMSMKQVVSSIKMQQIQPELAALKERYKDDAHEMMRAQQALFRKHGVNPLSGCLPLFIQLPIFIGLYKALSLDVNLYGAPLFTQSFRWCSNLSAPDMLIDWSPFWNSTGWFSFNMGQGMFCLGPYFNLLPMVTIVLFLVQQKFLMPPVVGNDEAAQQQRMMRRMMNFMMIFMGFMFFKVPSGLCVYFIVSSLWGILERQFHPKPAPIAPGVIDISPNASDSRSRVSGRSTTSDRTPGRKVKGRRVTEEEPKKTKGRLAQWWQDVLEKAKEQQKLAKSEQEKRSRNRDRKRR
ncbi:MAG: YidC/Oxa1 family insertase periplasmic-domain containing protein [Planctomycetia bacterium]|nr:YidC/Oxa1 family insertase periplasmic-domain containing protein [Planctomycetia bacterium]